MISVISFSYQSVPTMAASSYEYSCVCVCVCFIFYLWLIRHKNVSNLPTKTIALHPHPCFCFLSPSLSAVCNIFVTLFLKSFSSLLECVGFLFFGSYIYTHYTYIFSSFSICLSLSRHSQRAGWRWTWVRYLWRTWRDPCWRKSQV